MSPVKCPCCGAHLLLCDAAATPHAPKPWAHDTPIHALPVSTRAKHIVNDESMGQRRQSLGPNQSLPHRRRRGRSVRQRASSH